MTKAEKAAVEPTQMNCKEWHRLLGNVQAKLQGQAQEREALEGYVRTQPRLGKRKRSGVVDLMEGPGGIGLGSRTDELAIAAELQTVLQQEVAATSTSSTTTGTAGSGGIGAGGPVGGDDFNTDFDGVLADNLV